MELVVRAEILQSFSQPQHVSLGQILGQNDDVINFYKQISIFWLWALWSQLGLEHESILISQPRKISTWNLAWKRVSRLRRHLKNFELIWWRQQILWRFFLN